MLKNTASQKIGSQMITAADGTAFTGTVTVYVCGDAGTQALGSVGSGVCTHEGNGYHTYAPALAETNYALIAFTFIGSGAIPATVQVFTQIAQQTGDSFARIGAAVGASISADIAAVKAQTVAIEADTDVIDDGTSGLVKIASDVAAILVDTGTTIPGTITTAQADLDIITGATGVNLLAATQTSIDAIEADTNELQIDWADGGRLDLIQDIIAADTTTDIPALIAALENISAAEVNAEVVDALGTDTMPELSQGVPSATPTIKQALMLLYMALRDETLTTENLLSIKNDAGTVITKCDLADNGTTMTKQKLASGP